MIYSIQCLDAFDVQTLPRVSITKKQDLPSSPGIYIVVGEKIVQYVGRANNLQARWKSHHRLPELKRLQDVFICYLTVDNLVDLPGIESVLIDRLKPALNNREISKDVQREDGASISLTVRLKPSDLEILEKIRQARHYPSRSNALVALIRLCGNQFASF
jgi:excinuclease UvrABC nuclease subunit